MPAIVKLNSVLLGLLLFILLSFGFLLVNKQHLLFGFNYFLAAAYFGAFCLYVDMFWKDQDWFSYCTIGLAFLLTFLIFNFLISFSLSCRLFWLFGGIHLIYHILIDSKNQTRIKTANTCIYISLPLCIIIFNNFLLYNSLNSPLVLDEFLMAIDGTLGIYPSLILGRLFLDLPKLIHSIFLWSYVGLPLVLILIYLKRLYLMKEPPYSFMLEIILMGIIGYALYNVIPGCGGPVAFKTWPQSLPQEFTQTNPQWISCPPYNPRNSLPSLHTAWIICLLRQVWFCKRNTKILITFFIFGNFFAMFGEGHYLVDLIVGFAFANCIGGLCAYQLEWKNQARLQAIFLGGLLCLSWYLLILYGIPFLQTSKLLAWFVFSASFLLSIYFEYNLFKHSILTGNNNSELGASKLQPTQH